VEAASEKFVVSARRSGLDLASPHVPDAHGLTDAATSFIVSSVVLSCTFGGPDRRLNQPEQVGVYAARFVVAVFGGHALPLFETKRNLRCLL
jgi:hypothetical protein